MIKFIAGTIALAVLIASVIVGVSVFFDFEITSPSIEPVSFIDRTETKCPDQRLKPKLDYHSPCVQRMVMEYTDLY